MKLSEMQAVLDRTHGLAAAAGRREGHASQLLPGPLQLTKDVKHHFCGWCLAISHPAASAPVIHTQRLLPIGLVYRAKSRIGNTTRPAVKAEACTV